MPPAAPRYNRASAGRHSPLRAGSRRSRRAQHHRFRQFPDAVPSARALLSAAAARVRHAAMVATTLACVGEKLFRS